MVYINNYESNSCAGDTEELINAIYAKETKITIDNYFIKNSSVGLGKMKQGNFFKVLKATADKVLEKSNLENFNNTLLIVGSSVGGMGVSEQHYFKNKNYKNINPAEHTISVISDFLDKKFHFTDTRCISTACTSSSNALLLAKRLIDVGAYKNILIVGADALCHTTVCGFNALGVLSSKACTPFDEDRDGMNVAEAVAIILLQDEAYKNNIELLGVGASSDAYHMTNPDPEAKGAISSMNQALKDANIKISDIDYINAHGTGTLANDNVEALAIEVLFGNTPISSTKSITGHTLGASGSLEAIISCEVIKHNKLPPQTGLKKVQNKNINIVKEVIQKKINYVMSNSFAFGGNNTSLVFGVRK